MSRTLIQINTATDTFGHWLQKTNGMLVLFGNTVTTASNSSGDITPGNGYVQGIFGSNTLFSTTALRGGSVTASANLNITSNVIHTAEALRSTANAYINSANVTLNTANFVVSSNVGGVSSIALIGNSSSTTLTLQTNSHSISGNVSIANAVSMSSTLSVSGTSSLVGNVTFASHTMITSSALTTSGILPTLIDSFPAATYRGGRFILSYKDTSNNAYQMTEILVMHDGSDSYITEYGTLRSTSNNLMVINANVSSGNVRLYVTPTITAGAMKISKTLIAV